MPLGLAKDSMLNLAELASKTDDDENSQNGEIANIPSKNIANEKYEAEEQLEIEESQVDNENDEIGTSMVEELKAPIHQTTTTNGDTISTERIPSSSDYSKNPYDTKTQPSRNQTSTHQYAGFQADYYDFENYSYNFPGDDVWSNYGGSNEKKNKGPWWQCIFPWITSENDRYEKEDSSETDDLTTNDDEGPFTKDKGKEDDEISMISSGSEIVLGDGRMKMDKQTLSAQLGSAEPDARNGDAAGDDSIIKETSLKKKGILKSNSRAQYSNHLSTRSNASNGSNSSKTQKSERRSLFPSYEPKFAAKKNLHTSFSPMARVVTIKSSKDMEEQEKALIWWQKPDYDEFRKTGRLISKVMLQGGSEIWLATNESWQLPNQGRAATLRRAMANVDNEDASDKWWHKFGHSRRGLEHIASIDEGRQRQANVKTSIRAILAEQRRQKAFHREDPEKLRICSIQNTSWAKDLALASGASDADAVTKNFDDESRKSREFYLLKFSRAGKLNSTSNLQRGTKQVVPAFMQPMISMQLRPNRLDANTTSRLKFQRKEESKTSSNEKRVALDLAVMKGSNGGEISSKPSERVPIHDPAVSIPGKKSLASKAAGFANGEEAVNMSAVLTGMGPIPKSSNASRSQPVLA